MSEPANITVLSVKDCLALAEHSLCENYDVEYGFQCKFPGDIHSINGLESFNLMEWFQLTVTVIVFCISMVGNSAVLIIISSKPSLRTAMDLFLVNLSISDLLISVVCLMDNLLRSLSYTYLLGPVGCKAGSFIHMVCLFASVLTLVGIAIDRVYAVLFPLKTLNSSARIRHFLVGVIWVIAFVLASPFFVLKEYRVYKWIDFKEAQCTYTRGIGYYNANATSALKKCTHGYNYTYFYHTMVTVLMYFVPVAIIIVAYAMIVTRLWKSRAIGELSAESHLRNQTKKKIVRLALVVLSAFLFCWTPLQILIIISLTGHLEGHAIGETRIEFWIYLLAYSNSALNPIIYGGFNKTYRREFLSLFRSKRLRHASITNGGTVRILSSDNRPTIYQNAKRGSHVKTKVSVDLPICTFTGGRDDNFKGLQSTYCTSTTTRDTLDTSLDKKLLQ